MLCSVSPVSVSQPASTPIAAVVVIVEMGARREQLDGLEPVRGDLRQVLALSRRS